MFALPSNPIRNGSPTVEDPRTACTNQVSQWQLPGAGDELFYWPSRDDRVGLAPPQGRPAGPIVCTADRLRNSPGPVLVLPAVGRE
jgi:hypothetical protein